MRAFFHDAFSLNGTPCGYSDLKEIAHRFIQEGAAYEKELGNFLLDWISPKTTIVQKTSGSTGLPKEISISKDRMVSSAQMTGKFFELPAGTRALLCLPAATIAGKMMLIRALTLGWSLYLTQPSLNPLEPITENFDFTALTPPQAQNGLSALKQFKKVIIGGAAISQELRNDLAVNHHRIYETYGMTETITHVACRKISLEKDVPFQAMDGVHFEVDQRGCLVVYAPKIARHPVVTNDLVDLISSDRFYWEGRVDFVINSGGLKISPERLEKELAPWISLPFFVASEPDETLGQRIILIVESGKEPKQLLGQLRKHSGIPSNRLPKKVYYVPSFTLTASDKLNRGATLKSLKLK